MESQKISHKELERVLEQELQAITVDNEVSLCEEDFKDGKLSIFGYDHLKQLCEYVPHNEEILIKIPGEYEPNFESKLRFMGATDLRHIRQDRHKARMTAVPLLLIGIVFFVIGIFFEIFQRGLFQGIFTIISWVFVWAAVEKWFFDTKALSNQRKKLLQVLSSKIVIESNTQRENYNV